MTQHNTSISARIIKADTWLITFAAIGMCIWNLHTFTAGAMAMGAYCGWMVDIKRYKDRGGII